MSRNLGSSHSLLKRAPWISPRGTRFHSWNHTWRSSPTSSCSSRSSPSGTQSLSLNRKFKVRVRSQQHVPMLRHRSPVHDRTRSLHLSLCRIPLWIDAPLRDGSVVGSVAHRRRAGARPSVFDRFIGRGGLKVVVRTVLLRAV